MDDRVYNYLLSQDGAPVTMAGIAEAFGIADRAGRERVSNALITLRRRELVSRTKGHNEQLWRYYVGMNPADVEFRCIMARLAQSARWLGRQGAAGRPRGGR